MLKWKSYIAFHMSYSAFNKSFWCSQVSPSALPNSWFLRTSLLYSLSVDLHWMHLVCSTQTPDSAESLQGTSAQSDCMRKSTCCAFLKLTSLLSHLILLKQIGESNVNLTQEPLVWISQATRSLAESNQMTLFSFVLEPGFWSSLSRLFRAVLECCRFSV